MLNSYVVQTEKGILMFELVLALMLLMAIGSTLLALTSRHLRVIEGLSAALQKECEHPSCSATSQSATCSCGDKSWLVIHP